MKIDNMSLFRGLFNKKQDSKSNLVKSAPDKTRLVNISIGIEKKHQIEKNLIKDMSLPKSFDEIPYTENFPDLLKQKIDWDTADTNSYAMWFKSEIDNDFNKSFTKQLLTEIYNIQRTHYSFIIADLGYHLQLSPKHLGRMELPDEHSSFVFTSENNEKIVLSISKNKGIRFHFSSLSSPLFRLFFLKSFLIYCIALRNKISQIPQTIELDDGVAFILWWQNLCATDKEFQVGTSVGLIQN